ADHAEIFFLLLVRLWTRDDPGVRRTTEYLWTPPRLFEHAAMRNGNITPGSTTDGRHRSEREIPPQMPGPALGWADCRALSSLDRPPKNQAGCCEGVKIRKWASLNGA